MGFEATGVSKFGLGRWKSRMHRNETDLHKNLAVW